MNIQDLSINAIKVLGIDAINKANSGHPGMVLGAAPIAYTLYSQVINASLKDKNWINRDRFVLASGHASMLLYSTLHLAGYKISMDDIKNFRQVGSLTPGHPEVHHTDGVDCSSGPLGQGIAHGVGFAMAEAFLAAKYNKEDIKLIDHYTYVLAGDGDMQEGVTQEAISLAGRLGLNKLIVIYDNNDITLDGSLSLSSYDDTKKRFEACGWNVMVTDGESVDLLKKMITKAKKGSKPTLIIAKTTIGKGSINENTAKVHGAPLGEEDAIQIKEKLNWNYDKFVVPEEVYDHFNNTFVKRGNKAFRNWRKNAKIYEFRYPNEWEELNKALKADYSDVEFPEFEVGTKEATRVTSGKIINYIAKQVPTLLGGAADVAGSVQTKIKEESIFDKENYTGRNINFGIREFAMSCAQTGMLLHGGVRPYIGIFYVFSDYLKPSVRMAALMNVPSINICTHDSLAVGEDGPTHQPIEQLACFRTIPNTVTFRPAGAIETTYAWKYALNNKQGPVNIVLSRQNMTTDTYIDYESFIKGAYVVKYEKEHVDRTLIATGSEVSLAIEIAHILEERGLDVRVVSMPSTNLFDKLSFQERFEILGTTRDNIYSFELGNTDLWYKYAHKPFGINTFGYSGKFNEILDYIGFNAETLASKIS